MGTAAPTGLSRAASAAGWLRAANGQSRAGVPRPPATLSCGTGCTRTAGSSWGAAKLWSWSPRPAGLFSVDDRERWRVLLAGQILASGRKQLQSSPLTNLRKRERIREAGEDISYSHLSSGAWEQEMLEVVVKDTTDLLNLASSPLPLDFGADERT